MKKILLILLGFVLGCIITYHMAIRSIEIDAINEVDEGIITIKVFNQYHDYFFEK